MKLSEIMTKNVEVVSKAATVLEAAQKMRDLNVGSLPVVDGNKAIGMVTDRDITIRAVADGHDPKSTVVASVMSGDFVFCYEDQDVKDAAQVMKDRQIRRLPIVNRSNMLVGIVSLGDLSVDVKDDKLAGKTLSDISEPAKPDR